MFEFAFKTSGLKYKKNPIYEMQDIKLIQATDIPKNATIGELVGPDFVGKLAISYQKDNIGRSSGNAQWCKVYDCKNGEYVYKGTAIHKCVDPEYTEQNYNEKLFSVFGNLFFDSNYVRIPDIDLVKDSDFSDKPAILSYNIVHREDIEGQNKEEMTNMQTVALSIIERQTLKYDRVPLSTILEAVKATVNKHVLNEKKAMKKKVENAIMNSQISKQLGENEQAMTDEQEKLVTLMKEKIDEIDESTTSKSLLLDLSKAMGREVTQEEVEDININGTNIMLILRNIKALVKNTNRNYKELEKSIVQVTVVDLMTNNIDRHLNNWALIMDKETGRYTLGLFDHATSFFNMSLKNDYLAISQKDLKEHWATSSVLRDNPIDIEKVSSNGLDVFRELMENYEPYVIEILQGIHDVLPTFEKAIGYETISDEEFKQLSEKNSKKYYRSETDIAIPTKKVMEGFNMKFKRIAKDYGLVFDDERIDDEYRD